MVKSVSSSSILFGVSFQLNVQYKFPTNRNKLVFLFYCLGNKLLLFFVFFSSRKLNRINYEITKHLSTKSRNLFSAITNKSKP